METNTNLIKRSARHILLLLICTWLLPIIAHAEENRFLFVVDVSSGMSKPAPQALRAMLDMVASGMQSQLQPGDTLGIWTFNDQLHTDFPMQVWAETNKARVAENIATYWRTLSFGKKPHLETLLPSLFSVIRDSRTLTVLWINDGSIALHGTPFDTQINQLQAEYARELREANQCFVTVLACRKGEVVDFAVNSSIGPFRIPPAMLPTPKPKAPEVAVKPPPTNPAPVVKPKEMRRIVISPAPATSSNTAALAAITVPGQTNHSMETNTVKVETPIAPAEAKPAPATTVAPQAPLVAVVAPVITNPAVMAPPPAPAKIPTVAETPPTPATAPSPVLNSNAARAATVDTTIAQPPMKQAATAASETQASAPATNPPATPDTQPTAKEGSLPARLIAAGVLLIVAIVIIFVLLGFLRKGRAHPSLITESIKRTERESR